jgi:DNA-binding PadR family transcriptional regulator
MGNVYRFIEPVLLLMLKENGPAYGYILSENLERYALTDAQIERAALYRTLRTLEDNGYVKSVWDVDTGGPARRIYSLTQAGREHLREWAQIMNRLGRAMVGFSKKALADGRRPE